MRSHHSGGGCDVRRDPVFAEAIYAPNEEIEPRFENEGTTTANSMQQDGADRTMVQIPNLFDFATSELSQDAFICWLASWADPALKGKDEHLHKTATAFVDRLLEVGKGPCVSSIRSIEARTKWKDIDVLLVVNGQAAIIIEDKTDTEDHSNQLCRYKNAACEEFAAEAIAAVYLKTGNQAGYRRPTAAGYGCFLRRDLLAVLDEGERAGVRNDIFADFHCRLRDIEQLVQSFRTMPLRDWNDERRVWEGFFLALQEHLGDAEWGYVSNPRGGFMGFWWHSCNNRYLQLEDGKLCFKIAVADEPQWSSWQRALMAHNGANGLRLEGSRYRRGRGGCMTVAVLDRDYRQTDNLNQLDFEGTLKTLRAAEKFMDAAACAQ